MRSGDQEHVLKFIHFEICTKILISTHAQNNNDEATKQKKMEKRSEERNNNNNVSNAEGDERTVFECVFMFVLCVFISFTYCTPVPLSRIS